MSTPTPDHKDDPNTIHHPPGVAENEEDSAPRQDSGAPATEAPAKQTAATPAPITHPGG